MDNSLEDLNRKSDDDKNIFLQHSWTNWRSVQVVLSSNIKGRSFWIWLAYSPVNLINRKTVFFYPKIKYKVHIKINQD